ncbi:hypothetical protein [Chryseobacterium sp. Leaf394]|uniref:hypothetical protein n=1 Tax=Chryseobacterium sp. Leaf394 TaxID=1736361 RepID=UPI000ADD3A31|nr:hypothetical protein [Chryseobacterium sp. Leaf394]
MKQFLQIIFLVSCHFMFAQNQALENQLKIDSAATASQRDTAKTESNNIKSKMILPEKKSEPMKSVAEHDFDLEIRAILDYRLNRVLREDLFCLICETESDKGQLA